MARLIVLVIILAGGFYYWENHAEYRPEWIMKLAAQSGILNTSVDIDLDRDTDFTEQSLRRNLSHLYLSCDPQNTKMGDRVCWTYISEFNGIPAQMIAFFFKQGRYNYLRVSFDLGVHHEVKYFLDQNFEFMGVSAGSRKKFGQDLGMWKSRKGILSSMLEPPLTKPETLLTWLRQ